MSKTLRGVPFPMAPQAGLARTYVESAGTPGFHSKGFDKGGCPVPVLEIRAD